MTPRVRGLLYIALSTLCFGVMSLAVKIAVSPSLPGASPSIGRLASAPVTPAEIEERIGWEIRGQIPPAADQCALAALRGIPIVQLQPEAVVSQAIQRLAGTFA